MKYVRNCDQCRKRKLKCDRVSPCGPCRTRNCASSCLFSGLPGSQINDNGLVEFGHPRPNDDVNEKASAAIAKKTKNLSRFKGSSSNVAAADYPLPSEEEITFFADQYFDEQNRGYTTYVITRSAFEKGRVHANTDPAWRSMVHAVCGIGVLFMPKPDPSIFAPHLLAAEALLDHHCDTERHPELLHVRITYLLILGLGPLRGPHLSGRVQKGVFLAHTLNLHLEPDERLPLVEKQDRVVLFSTIVKSDYFCALGTGKTFTMTQPDAEALPSLFGWIEGGENILGLDNSILFSIKMSNIARKIVERERKNRHKWYQITIELQDELRNMEEDAIQLGRTQSDQSTMNESRSKMTLYGSPKTELAFNSALFKIGYCSLRWCLYKPSYLFQGSMYKPQLHSLHLACMESAFEQLEALQEMFQGYVETYMVDTYNPPSPPKRVEMLGVWFPIFLTLRCALFIKNHLDFLERLPVQDMTSKEEQNRCINALRKMRWLLKAISKHSVIARDGFLALQESSKQEDMNGNQKMFDAVKQKRNADTMNGSDTPTNSSKNSLPSQPSLPTSASPPPNKQQKQGGQSNGPNSEVPSSILDDLIVFKEQGDYGTDFWDMISWMEPTLS